jgi:hypothetical protein
MSSINLPKIPRPVRIIASFWKLLAIFLTLTGPLSLIVGLWFWHLISKVVNGENAESISIENVGLIMYLNLILVMFGAVSLPIAPIAFRASFHLRKMKRRGIFYSRLISVVILLGIIAVSPIVIMMNIFGLAEIVRNPLTFLSLTIGAVLLLIDTLIVVAIALAYYCMNYLGAKDMAKLFS